MNSRSIIVDVEAASDTVPFRPCSAADLRAGYNHPGYAESLSEFGTPFDFPGAGSSLLSRAISGTADRDLMGCYPLFCCKHPEEILPDLDAARNQFVAASLVWDPFAACDEAFLRRCFDVVMPFKTHFVVDLEKPIESFTSSTHRKFARRAQRELSITLCTSPIEELDNWVRLYGELAQRHGIKGMRAFSRRAFERQLQLPGTVLFRASCNGEVVGLDWWFLQGDVAQGHLAATNALGYERHAAYGLKLAIIEYFKGKARWLNLGGAAGLNPDAKDGLAAFKRGWASDQRIAYFCGKVLNRERYSAILAERRLTEGAYFPPYRQGEFA